MLKNILESIIINRLTESEDEYNFLKKVKTENPELYARFHSIVRNKSLDIAIEKYKEYDPEMIKQKGKEQKKLERQISKLERQAQAYSELKDFMDIINYMKKNYSINKGVSMFFKSLKNNILKFNSYKTKDNINPLYEKRPNNLKRYVDNGLKIPLETTEIFNKFDRYDFGDGGDTIKIKSYIDTKKSELYFDIYFYFYPEIFLDKSLDVKIINHFKEKWNGKNYYSITYDKLISILNLLIDDFDLENIKEKKEKILSKLN
jgi:hypothetical protein